MELTLWTYEGPPHVGAMRIASSMKDIHYVLHAPQGDTYADLLFTMIERRGQRPHAARPIGNVDIHRGGDKWQPFCRFLSIKRASHKGPCQGRGLALMAGQRQPW